MSYVKTVWETGDIITAEKLNNAESGIEDAYGLNVTMVAADGGTAAHLDKTYEEILAADHVRFTDTSVLPGATVIYNLCFYGEHEGSYIVGLVNLYNASEIVTYLATSSDGVLELQGTD